VPLYRQIEQTLKREIQSGALSPDTKLQSTRELAASLCVSRAIVGGAYAELESQGLVYTRHGSGTYVSPPLEVHQGTRDLSHGAQDWPLWQQALLSHTWQSAFYEMHRLLNSVSHPDHISFAERTVDSELWPVEDLRKAIQKILRRDGAAAVRQSFHEAGFLPLRTTVARILSSEGIPTHPDNVLITSGSQQALDLVARTLLRPGDVVLVESPTYEGAIDLFRSLDVRLLGIPVDEHGMKVGMIEDALRTAHPRLIFTIPTFHNPTGTCLNGYRRRQLVALADRYNVPILEDDYIGNLRYDGPAEPALKALDIGGRVIYAGTFSKTLMPGLRVGFLVAAGPVYDRLVRCKHITDLATSTLIQRTLEEYITVGRYRAHLRKIRRAGRQCRDAMLEALDRYMPDGTRWLTPKGGRFIWLTLPAGLVAIELFDIAAEEGVTFVPGRFFFPGQRSQSHLRLNFEINPPDVIEEGVIRLSRAVKRLLDTKGGLDLMNSVPGSPDRPVK
jgi:GntR family transcriptional regulator/MocR family aminotransferase